MNKLKLQHKSCFTVNTAKSGDFRQIDDYIRARGVCFKNKFIGEKSSDIDYCVGNF